jgi:hypothetical protein
MVDSNFKDEEIRRHLRETASKRKNVDYDRAKLMSELKAFALRGSEEEFEAKLVALGIKQASEQWRKAKAAYQSFRQSR